MVDSKLESDYSGLKKKKKTAVKENTDLYFSQMVFLKAMVKNSG